MHLPILPSYFSTLLCHWSNQSLLCLNSYLGLNLCPSKSLFYWLGAFSAISWVYFSFSSPIGHSLLFLIISPPHLLVHPPLLLVHLLSLSSKAYHFQCLRLSSFCFLIFLISLSSVGGFILFYCLRVLPKVIGSFLFSSSSLPKPNLLSSIYSPIGSYSPKPKPSIFFHSLSLLSFLLSFQWSISHSSYLLAYFSFSSAIGPLLLCSPKPKSQVYLLLTTQGLHCPLLLGHVVSSSPTSVPLSYWFMSSISSYWSIFLPLPLFNLSPLSYWSYWPIFVSPLF